MGEGFALFDIILMAMVAAFLILRLRSVLGRRTGHERPPAEAMHRTEQANDDNVISLPDNSEPANRREPDPVIAKSPASAGLTKIQIADPGFDGGAFLAGAKAAYETTIGAFAAGDLDRLRALLSDDVSANFSQAIESREARGETLEQTLVGIKSADITEAALDERTRATVTIKFVSEVLRATRGEDGSVVDGDEHAVRVVTDVWIFSRDLRSRDPNWTLVETRAE